MPQPDTDEVEDILARQSPNVGSMFMVGEDDAPGAQSAAPPRAPILAPGVPRSSSGAPLPPPPPNIQWMGAQPKAQSGDIYSQVRDLPLDQAEAAVSSALKFQAIRGYQRDLQEGKSPAEALTKWAPIMFTAPKAGNLGQAAALARQAQATKPMIRDVAGQLIRVNPDGTTTPLTPPKRIPPSQFDLQEHKSYLDEMRKLEKEIDDDPSGPEADQKRQKLQYLQKQAETVRTRSAVTPPPSTAKKRVKVKNSAGKVGTIPEEQLAEALAAGYTRVQ